MHGLVAKATELSGPIHGIVFPETSISFEAYSQVLGRAVESHNNSGCLQHIEFIVAGTYTNDRTKPERGNFACATVFYRRPSETRGGKPAIRLFSTIQQKHHRWRIDANQIERYGLGSALSASRHWWEGIELLSRRLNVMVFRHGTVLAPLICEDLARLEPVHELIRSIGPNLVIALLADGPQVDARWPGRYATGLADDPGSSVLTLTSFGLINRANERAPPEYKSDSIGLWRDDRGHTKTITLDKNAAAVVISLSGEPIEEHTLEGRSDGGSAVRYHFADQVNVPFPADSKVGR